MKLHLYQELLISPKLPKFDKVLAETTGLFLSGQSIEHWQWASSIIGTYLSCEEPRSASCLDFVASSLSPSSSLVRNTAICASLAATASRVSASCRRSSAHVCSDCASCRRWDSNWRWHRPSSEKEIAKRWRTKQGLMSPHTHPFNGPLSGTTQVSQYQKDKTNMVLLKQETVSGSCISWAICKSAPRSRQITMPAPHHSVFYRPDPLLAAQPTASKHWRHKARFCIPLNTK